MRLRIQLTNGQETIDLYWLKHTGTDVYCGPNIGNFKLSYHASGKFHTASQGKRQSEEWRMPLSEFEGYCQLGGVGFNNSSDLFVEGTALKRYTGRRSDSILTIDSRSFHAGCSLSVMIGLLELGRFDLLGNRIMPPDPVRLPVEQILLATNVAPWVWVMLIAHPPYNALGTEGRP